MTKPLIGTLLAIVMSAGVAAEQLFNRVSLKPFKSGDFAMEYPDGGGWRQTPPAGAGDLLMILSKQPDIRVFVRRSRLVQPVSQSDEEEVLKLFAQYEAEAAKEETSEATEFKSALLVHPTLGRVVRIEYMQPGMVTSNPSVRERVLRFSVPAGSVLYRIIFSGSPREFDKELGRFNAMLDSIRIGTPPAQDDQP